MKFKKVIIDTDPGVDDALAIAMAIKSDINIVGIATVFGNSNVANTSQNTLSILELLNSDIQVYRGMDLPLEGDPVYASSHGDNGLGNVRIETLKKKNSLGAEDFYIKTLELSEEHIVIIAIGPLTNIANLLIKRPDLVEKIEEIIILGGVIGEEGNITKYAEFNVFNDPLAFKTVINYPKLKKTVVPANICRNVVFTNDTFQKINNSELANDFKKISKLYIDYYQNNSEYGGFEGGVMYDLLAISYYLDSNLFKVDQVYLSVDISNSEERGRTKILELSPNCELITSVDALKVEELFINCMNKT
jgi:purine nucleosidase